MHCWCCHILFHQVLIFFHHYDNYFHMPTRKQEELHQARLSELDQMTGERDTARGEFETMRKQRLDEFMAGFSTITNKLKEMYQVRSLSTFYWHI